MARLPRLTTARNSAVATSRTVKALADTSHWVGSKANKIFTLLLGLVRRRRGIRQGTKCQSSNLLWQNARTRFIFTSRFLCERLFFESCSLKSSKSEIETFAHQLDSRRNFMSAQKDYLFDISPPFYVSIEWEFKWMVMSLGKLAFSRWIPEVYRSSATSSTASFMSLLG